jgi:hypothetical protein
MAQRMSAEEALGTLIASANPYLKAGGAAPLPAGGAGPPPAGGAPAPPAGGAPAPPAGSAAPQPAMHLAHPKLNGKGMPVPQKIFLSEIQLEEETKYPSEWMFKGQAQKIAKAVRIRYSYPKKGQGNNWYMVDDYLLVGYEGSDGAG